jgi:hypothetical protein
LEAAKQFLEERDIDLWHEIFTAYETCLLLKPGTGPKPIVLPVILLIMMIYLQLVNSVLIVVQLKMGRGEGCSSLCSKYDKASTTGEPKELSDDDGDIGI